MLGDLDLLVGFLGLLLFLSLNFVGFVNVGFLFLFWCIIVGFVFWGVCVCVFGKDFDCNLLFLFFLFLWDCVVKSDLIIIGSVLWLLMVLLVSVSCLKCCMLCFKGYELFWSDGIGIEFVGFLRCVMKELLRCRYCLMCFCFLLWGINFDFIWNWI